MSARIETFAALAASVRASPPRCGPVRLVAVDGPGGAGKSLFATRLAVALEGVDVVHTDDFASWEEPTDWWPRLERQLLIPFQAGRPGRFQRYDWDTRRMAEWHDVPAAPVIVIEGVSSARAAVADRLALAVWIEAPAAVRLARGVERDGEEMRAQWLRWMSTEAEHHRADRTSSRAQIVVDGDPRLPHRLRDLIRPTAVIVNP